MNSTSSSSSIPSVAIQGALAPGHSHADPQRGGAWRMALAMALSGTIGLFVLESGLPVEAVVLSRCVLGALALGAWVGMRREWVSVARRDAWWLAAGGVALVANWVALFHAYAFAGVGVATVVYHVQPFFLVIVAAWGGERIGARRMGWMVLALGGVVLSSGRLGGMHVADHVGAFKGVALALLAAALYTLTVVATRRTRHIPAAQTAMLQMLAGAAALAAWATPIASSVLLVRSAPLAQALVCMLVLGLVHTAVMYVLMYGALQRLGAGAIAILSFIYPAVALMVDLLWFGVRPDAWQWSGIALIAVAIAGYRVSELRP